MLTTFAQRSQAQLVTGLQMVFDVVFGARTRPAGARAITFIEYAILAAIAVAIGFIFRNQLGALFNTLFDRLGTAININ